jgi:RNA polymerase-binding transcription factor DksA
MCIPFSQHEPSKNNAVSGETLKPVTDCWECGLQIGSVRQLERPGTIFCGECALIMELEGEDL